MAEEPLRLTGEHKHVLAVIGTSGATHTRLDELGGSRELYELERAEYVWRDFIELKAPGAGITATTIWYLTERGASAIGVNTARIYRP